MTLFVFILAGSAGLVMHWAVKYGRKQCCKDFWTYMRENHWHSIGSVGGMVASVMALAAGGAEVNSVTIATAYLAGYSFDSMVNK